MARSKRFVGLVLNEAQAKLLLHLLTVIHQTGVGSITRRRIHQMKAKLSKSIKKLDEQTTDIGVCGK